ncbi:RNA pyrophosphohydrolase [Sinisalibacter aestuarii]|uniref:RNA pyrophosphohydrolase n=1 Tax=Sinisalibacter aestuarii TaxID=2949426 RepID=A0ABQ5LQD5_9RHOB|nr:RNA pyrophosphohydrolase [Sinisalibacter aestuarii]GKY86272.1 RNA pyrophosphohydrolase [Sinisalibacter aestuarii]
MTPDEIARLPYRPNVGIVLANPAGLIFAGQRIDAARLGTGETAWQMPQGGIDAGEDPADAALRELEEETGVTRDLVTVEAELADWLTYDLPLEVVPRIWKGRYRGQKQRWYLMRFHGADDQIVIETAHPEFRRWTWIDPTDLIEKIVPFKRDIYTHVIAAFGDRL